MIATLMLLRPRPNSSPMNRSRRRRAESAAGAIGAADQRSRRPAGAVKMQRPARTDNRVPHHQRLSAATIIGDLAQPRRRRPAARACRASSPKKQSPPAAEARCRRRARPMASAPSARAARASAKAAAIHNRCRSSQSAGKKTRRQVKPSRTNAHRSAPATFVRHSRLVDRDKWPSISLAFTAMPLVEGIRPGLALIDRDCGAQRPRHALEARFGDVMVVGAIEVAICRVMPAFWARPGKTRAPARCRNRRFSAQ